MISIPGPIRPEASNSRRTVTSRDRFNNMIGIVDTERRSMDAYNELIGIYDEISTIGDISSLLGWDQNTYMPRKAAAGRGGQSAFLSKLVHRKVTDPRVGYLLDRLEGEDLSGTRAAVVREIRRIYKRKTSVPEELEAEIARSEPLSVQAWAEAKQKKDFSIFAPNLEHMLELKKKVAEKVGYPDIPYDAMLEEYEPYTRTAQVREVLERLKKRLVPVIERISEAEGQRIDISGKFPREAQESFCRRILVDIGYDFERGRLDTTEHPFTIGTGDDTRITTHFYENDLRPALFSCIHEGGHALYEQGFLKENMHTPLGEACSLGIHESQSRMWENLIGRSLPFWKRYYPDLQSAFPGLSALPLEDFYQTVNRVRPSLIRIEADEVTYSMHILIRFELEIEIFNGRLDVREIPQAWNEGYEKYLGVVVENDGVGCLQDIHWSFGSFGYFPTYTLGNLYAAQFFDAMKKDIDVEASIERGEFGPILTWLRSNIHEKGKLYPASELVRVVTGKELDESHFIDHLRNKFGAIYGIDL
ncbi:MAG: carboxypeptidase M32 [Candidatus Thermoplasmatota archaeon]|nr:carboxypeptidase M32 [Candidatus Thermoplasmatota archaeon]